MAKSLTIKKRLIITVIGIFFSSTTFMGFYSYKSQMNQLRESLKDKAQNENRLFQTILAADAEGLARAQSGLGRLASLLKPFAEKNRDQLLSASTPIFQDLKRINNITHMYFINPDGTVFLRAHKPEQFGDRLERATFKMAAETKTISTGLEMGKNFFSLRCVQPVYYEGNMIGFLEVAEEIDHIFHRMKAINGDDVSLFLTRNFLDSYSMDFGTENIGNFSILYPTAKNVSLALANRFIDTMQRGLEAFSVSFVDLHGAKYVVGVGPIHDAFGTTAGILFSQRDITSLYSALWKGIISSITIFAIIFLSCIALFYISLRKSAILFNALRQHILAVTKTWDLSARLEVDTGDEIAELVDDFNLMKDEIKKLKESLERRADELLVSNRELEAFSYSLSHDLRQPLSRIYSAVQLLQDGYAANLDETGNFLVDTICQASEGMEELIEAILVLSRITRSEINRREIDLSGLAHEIAAELQGSEPVRKVEWIIPPRLVCTGDPQLLKVALQNLLENAWKYTRTASHPQIEVGMIDHNGGRVFFVRDNGVGFDMKDAGRLFKPFQRLHGANEFPGTGIGLATVERIIHRHGGKIWGEGEEGKGATFFFTLP
jgi:signal transduction histidine kinase